MIKLIIHQILINTFYALESEFFFQAKLDSIQASKQSLKKMSENGAEYDFYDLGNKILQVIKNKAGLTSFVNDEPPMTSANVVIPEATFNTVTYDVEPIADGQVSSKSIFLSENDVDLLLPTGNESFAGSRLSRISSWDMASELIGRGMPGLVALGYEN